LEILSDSALSLRQAFIHHDLGNLQAEPFRQPFQAHCELLKLKARDSNDRPRVARRQNTATNVPVWAKRMDHQRTAFDEVSLVWLHRQCNLFLPASIRMWVRSSTRGIGRDEVSMLCFSFSHLHSCSSSSLIPQQLLVGIVVDHHVGAVYVTFSGRPRRLHF
jgi:hypothetical protein